MSIFQHVIIVNCNYYLTSLITADIWPDLFLRHKCGCKSTYSCIICYQAHDMELEQGLGQLLVFSKHNASSQEWISDNSFLNLRTAFSAEVIFYKGWKWRLQRETVRRWRWWWWWRRIPCDISRSKIRYHPSIFANLLPTNSTCRIGTCLPVLCWARMVCYRESTLTAALSRQANESLLEISVAGDWVASFPWACSFLCVASFP